MRIQLSSRIALWNANLGKVAITGDLNVVRCFNPVGADDGAVRDQTGAVTVLQAPCDLISLWEKTTQLSSPPRMCGMLAVDTYLSLSNGSVLAVRVRRGPKERKARSVTKALGRGCS